MNKNYFRFFLAILLFSGGALMHSVAHAVLPTVSNVLPKVAVLYETQEFAVYGQNLNSLFNPWIKNCRYIRKLVPRFGDDPSKIRRFRCTPFMMGTMEAKIRYTTVNPPSTIPLHLFNVQVKGPKVTSVTPTTLTYGQMTTITVRGERLTPYTKLWVENCWRTRQLSGGTWSKRRYRCWPRVTAGIKKANIKVPWHGRTVLAKQFHVPVQGPAITSVRSFAPIVLGQKAYIRVFGSNLSPRMGLRMEGCRNITHLGGNTVGGTSTQRIFTCIPRYKGGWKDVTVYRDRSYPKGTVWKGQLFVNTPVVTSITSDVIIGGQPSAYRGQPVVITVNGQFLSSNTELRYSLHTDPRNFFACYGLKKLGGTATSRRFTCNATWSWYYNRIRFGVYDKGQYKFLTLNGRTTQRTDPQIRLYFAEVTSITPNRGVYNQYVTITVTGNGLWRRTSMRLPGCWYLRKLAGGTANQQQFRCKPVQKGWLTGQILDGYRVMRNFRFFVADPVTPPPPPPPGNAIPIVCGPYSRSGSDQPQRYRADMGQPAGTFRFSYDTYQVKDQIVLRHQGTVIYNTGCVGHSSFANVNYNSADPANPSNFVDVDVYPNCAGTQGTGWDFTVQCP